MTEADIHPEHGRPDHWAIEERLEELGITILDDHDGAGVGYDEPTAGAVFYTNLPSYSPNKSLVLAESEMWALVDYWVDGYCLCGEEIPQDHYLCRSCLSAAMGAWGVAE